MSQRMFIAAWAHDVAVRVANLQRQLGRAGGQIRWVAKDQIHLTVKFLGETTLLQTAAICKSMAQVAQQHPLLDLEFRGAGAFPNINRPRTLWVDVCEGAEAFTALHQDVDQAMADLGFAPERRFQPHLTIGRVRSIRDSSPLTELLEQHAEFEAGRAVVTELTLVSSRREKEGPIYEVLGRAALGIS